MAGLRRICKMYGGMTVSANGKTTHYVWDYAKDEPVDKKLMTKARQKASDIALAKIMKEQFDQSRRLDPTEIESGKP